MSALAQLGQGEQNRLVDVYKISLEELDSMRQSLEEEMQILTSSYQQLRVQIHVNGR